MLGSAVLDVAIGLIFVFLLLSLMCSAARELIEMFLKQRAKDLEKGIGELLGDPGNQKKFLELIYQHGLVNSLFRGVYKAGSGQLPSYIPARNFALALLAVVESNPAIIPANVKDALKAFEATAEGDLIKTQEAIEGWYNSAMDRVAGWYKRRTQVFILILGLIVAVGTNADCIAVARTLSTDSSVRQSVVALAQATASKQDQSNSVSSIKANIDHLAAIGLPFGWSPEEAKDPASSIPGHFLGWILTALAVSLGAPFWFDLLNKIIVVRSTVKPHEKSREEASKN